MLWLASILVLAPVADADSLKVSEKLGQIPVRFKEEGETFYDVADQGRFAATATISLAGVDVEDFNSDTAVSITLGEFTFSGMLGDDPRYRAGRKSAVLVHTRTSPFARGGGSQKVLRVSLSWNKSRLKAKILGITPELETPIIAQELLGSRPGPFDRQFTACIHLGNASEKFEVTANGKVKSRAFRKGESDFDLQSVSLRGKGLATGDCIDEVGPLGGTAQLPNVASIIFPAGAFPSTQSVNVAQTNTAETANDFKETSSIFGVGARTSYEVRVNSGSVAPLTDFEAVLHVPDTFLQTLPANSELQVFAQIYQGDGDGVLDGFELFRPIYDEAAKTLRVTLPATAFTDMRTMSGGYEAILVISSTPTKPLQTAAAGAPAPRRLASDTVQETSVPPSSLATIIPPPARTPQAARQTWTALAAPSTCNGASLGKPFEENFPRSSPYKAGSHYGTDYAVPVGTDILAMSDGVVERIKVDERAIPKPDPRSGKLIKGYGQYVVIKHTDGSRTLYAHLIKDSVQYSVGDTVSKGDIIASSGNTGGSSGPHLHIEYAPNGSIYLKANKVDPEPCINVTVSGSITVRDNGNLADDAFSVSINGLSVCSTSIGATNTCAIGNLRPGNATLRITAYIAPDDVGTYQIFLADGLTFANGSTTTSGTVPEGGSASFTIIIPDQSASLPPPSEGCCSSSRRSR